MRSSLGLKTPSCSDLISCDGTHCSSPWAGSRQESTGRPAAAGAWKWSIPPCHIFLLGSHSWGARPRFPPVSASGPTTHSRRSFCCSFPTTLAVFFFPATKWTDQVPTECQTLTGLISWLCKLMAIILCSGRHWKHHSNNIQSLSSYVPTSQINDQYFVLCMFRQKTNNELVAGGP